MEFGELLTILVGLVVVGVGIYQVRNGTKKPGTTSEAIEAYWDVLRLVETYAPAADQLLKVGKLKPEDRMKYVIDMVFSYVDTLDVEQVRGMVEGWVANQKKAE